MFLIETPDEAGIQSFIKRDPFTRNDVCLDTFSAPSRLASLSAGNGSQIDGFRESVAQKWVICISFGAPAIKRCPIGLVIGGTAVQALRQIRIGKIRSTERYHVR